MGESGTDTESVFYQIDESHKLIDGIELVIININTIVQIIWLFNYVDVLNFVKYLGIYWESRVRRLF